MPHISDVRYDALRAQFPTVFHTNDLLFEFAKANGGTGNTLNDLIYTMLIAQGASPLHVNDMWAQVLALQGFTGSLNDQLFGFWQAGGSFGGSPLDNYLLDDTNLDEYLLDDASADDVWLLDGAPFIIAKDADQYVLGQDFTGPGATGLNFRYDQRWHPNGTRTWFRIGGTSHPAYDNLFQYDVSPAWSLNPAHMTLTGSVNIGNDSSIRTISWVNNGTRLVFLNTWFSSFRRMDSVPCSTAYDINTIGAADGSFTGLIGNEFGQLWSADWSEVIVSRLAGTWSRYQVPVPGDLNSMAGPPDQSWQADLDSGVSSSLAIDSTQTKVYSRNSANFLVSWDLTGPFDFSAPFNYNVGVNLQLPTTGGIWRGFTMNPATGEIFTEGDQNFYRLRSFV